MNLRSTTVSRCLEKKLLFFGFELVDVLAIFMLLALLNLTLGQTEHKITLVWLPTLAVALGLRLAKRGKPDHFLIHWVQFQMRPRVLAAFPEPTTQATPPKLQRVMP